MTQTPFAASRIVVHCTNGVQVTFTDCLVMWRNESWVHFQGKNDLGKETTLMTSLRVEIYQ